MLEDLELAAHCFIGLPGPEIDKETEWLLTNFPPGGVVLFARNVTPEAEQVKALTSRLQEISLRQTGRPMVIAIDQEGGSVKRLPPPFGQYPAAASYGPQGEEAVYEWGLNQGRELAELGVTMNLAPVLDVNTLGGEGIMKDRAFGSDPETVTRLGLAAVSGLRAAGVIPCAKHFPGIGHSTLDSHKVRPEVTKSRADLENCELVPFRSAIEAGIEAVMVSHLIYTDLDPEKPASLSRPVMDGLLRNELGYDGLILTDDLQMCAITGQWPAEKAACLALAAGADRVLICQDLSAYVRLVEG